MSGSDATESLNQILEQALRLKNHVLPPSRPHIDRGLEQIESQSRQLLTRATGEEDVFGAKTQLFLAKGGVDADELSGRVQDTRMDVAFESLHVLPDIDVEGFLRHEHEQSIVDTIDEGSLQTATSFEEYAEAVMQHEWNEYKKRVYRQCSQNANIHYDCVQEPAAFASMITRPVNAGPAMNTRTARYLTVVKNLNDSRLAKGTYAVINAFEEATLAMGTQPQWQQVAECWRVLASVLGEKDARKGEFKRGPLLQGQYLRAYNDTQGPARAGLYRQFIAGAQSHLESQFLLYMDKQIHGNLREANLGGVPSAINTVRAFLNLPLWRNSMLGNPNIEVIQGAPIWATTYLLLRSGKFADARDYVLGHRSLFDAVEPTFQEYLCAYLDNDRRLPKILQDRLHAEFNQRLRHARETTDPYKFALYKIIGRCELRKKTIQEVVHTIEDYLWLQFMLLSDEQEANVLATEKYTLAELQSILLKFGPEHFNQRGSNPLHYLQVLLLTGQFERAISYLYELDDFYSEAVHFAIAMAYYGVIRHHANHSTVRLVSTQKDAGGVTLSSLDYAKVIYQYAHHFRDSAEDAFHYLSLLCFDESTPAGKTYTNICHSWMRELILESKDYEPLLGSPQNDGTIAPGCMQRYMSLVGFASTKAFTSAVTIKAAEACDANGQFLDAVKLFNIGEEYDRVYRILIHQLGNRLATHRQRARQGLREPADELVSQAQNIQAHYERFSHILSKVSPEHQTTLRTLIRLYSFFVDCSNERYEEALLLMEEQRLLPLQGDLPAILQRCEELNDLDDAIVRNLPELILATMDAIYQVYKRLKDSPYTDIGRQNKMAQLRAKGRALMVFAGMNQYRTPTDVYAQLNKLDVLMG
ncbi:Nup93/Nic96-domain-containing protein [Thamnocephalis sphaerospora]|uniref:Nuclear pore protein n=1 Tax=Thamnocephalis sphaerospora TaxID=78915 RepID=A0A4P9XJJ2_9FUNG|nr:Nup93/Nic96-domain-containing protein [Thamnocephalis sphaerospora]|eukprot:RKP05933.1 Nup93/Nic96-domain-containing protein [Thamnocephalis sphaerospora]